MIYRWKISQLGEHEHGYMAESPYGKFEFSNTLENLIENILYKSYPLEKHNFSKVWIWEKAKTSARFMFYYKPSQVLKTIKNKYPEEFV